MLFETDRMTRYRLYFMAPCSNHILRVQEFEAATDTDAVTYCDPLRGAEAMELWFTGRKIHRWEAIEQY